MSKNLKEHLEEELALRKKFIEEDSGEILRLEEELTKIDQERNKRTDFSSEELEVFNINYESRNALKERVRQRIEENQEAGNELKKKLENLR